MAQANDNGRKSNGFSFFWGGRFFGVLFLGLLAGLAKICGGFALVSSKFSF